MPRPLLLVYLSTLLLALSPVCAQAVATQEVLDRVRAAVRDYGALVEEIDLGRLPMTLLHYAEITNRLDALGQDLEGISRLGGRSEALTEDEWRQLDAQSAVFAASLLELRRQSLPLRVWAYFDAHEHPTPTWGLAVTSELKPLPPVKGTFDATATDEWLLTGKAGETLRAQVIVLPLTVDLKAVLATSRPLRAAGALLAADRLRCEPISYDSFPDVTGPVPADWWTDRLLKTRPDVSKDQAQAFLLTVDLPAELKPGRYTGPLVFSTANTKPLILTLTVQVEAPPEP